MEMHTLSSLWSSQSPMSSMKQQQTQFVPSSYQVPLVPNNLARPPSLWTVAEVRAWVNFCMVEYDFGQVCLSKFDMNGKAMCLLTRTDFMERAPQAGDVLFNAFQRLRQQEVDGYHQQPHMRQQILVTHNTPLCSHTHVDPHLSIHNTSNGRVNSYVPILPQPPVNTDNSDKYHPRVSPDRDEQQTFSVPVSMLSPASIDKTYSSDSDSCHNETSFISAEEDDCSPPIGVDNFLEEDLKSDGECRLLWEFIYQLLVDAKYRDLVCWESIDDLVFRINNPTLLAEHWGRQKNRTNMTYEKLSRALRYYYKMKIVRKVPSKRLTYQFLQHPTKIQKGQRGAKPHTARLQAEENLVTTESNLPPTPPLSARGKEEFFKVEQRKHSLSQEDGEKTKDLFFENNPDTKVCQDRSNSAPPYPVKSPEKTMERVNSQETLKKSKYFLQDKLYTKEASCLVKSSFEHFREKGKRKLEDDHNQQLKPLKRKGEFIESKDVCPIKVPPFYASETELSHSFIYGQQSHLKQLLSSPLEINCSQANNASCRDLSFKSIEFQNQTDTKVISAVPENKKQYTNSSFSLREEEKLTTLEEIKPRQAHIGALDFHRKENYFIKEPKCLEYAVQEEPEDLSVKHKL